MTTVLRSLVVTAVLAAMASGCAARRSRAEPACDVSRSTTGYSFWRRAAGDKEVLPIATLEVRRVAGGRQELLWSIEVDGGLPASHVTYGEVPEGFAQYFPSHGFPAKLRAGEEYEVRCGNGSRRFSGGATGYARAR
jgi:hypothetical protein